MSYHPIESSNEGASSSSQPLYHDHSPAVVIAGKALGVTSVVMVIVAIVVSIIEVHRDWTYSLLIINLIISFTVISFLALWYKQGHLAAQGTTKAKREPNFSEEERLCLLNFVQQHKTKLLGKAGRPGHGDDKVEERKAKYWKLCAESIKAAGGKERDWRKVRKQWFDLKDKAKKLKREMGVTGGGPKPSSSASMELAMEVVAREALEGIRKRTTEVDPMGHASAEMSQAPNKMWFLFVTASILIFQCITTIVYVTAHKVYTPGNTLAPAFTAQAASTIKPITKSPGLSLMEASDFILAPPR